MRYIELEEDRICNNCGNRKAVMAISFWEKGYEIPVCSKCMKELLYNVSKSN